MLGYVKPLLMSQFSLSQLLARVFGEILANNFTDFLPVAKFAIDIEPPWV